MEDIIDQIKKKYKYAADYGFILAGYIALFYMLDFLFFGNAFVNVLGTLGFWGTIFVCYYLAVRYRDKACGGYIRFGQVWSFGIWLFFFAGLLMAVLYYVRFQFLQPDYLSSQWDEVLLLAEQMKYSKEQMDALMAFGSQTPIQWVFYYLCFYVFGGAILFLLISPMVSRKKPEDNIHVSDQENTYEPYQDKNDSDESKL
ncbi:MAG: DUF4199 domain-containing protein [Bacteroidales bacterium]|nr:DUF4199 domain-containing protein [Bacteroidales bacterium]MDD3907195.1 DUF4199 domain-containing protein [Bacteroidales bacterium]MDD4712871.1 DUF4199 domain-containing protein [Bacteroidales bacterium]